MYCTNCDHDFSFHSESDLIRWQFVYIWPAAVQQIKQSEVSYVQIVIWKFLFTDQIVASGGRLETVTGLQLSSVYE